MFILLDIDGVMIPARGWSAPELLSDDFPEFSSKAVASLNKIIGATNASLLLTTSHKFNFSLSTWKQIFQRRGIDAEISRLDSREKFENRKEEILFWLKSHQSDDKFVIIDDDKSLNALPTQLKNKLILTSSLIGLNDELADKAIHAIMLPLSADFAL